jgi:hypothetical protein
MDRQREVSFHQGQGRFTYGEKAKNKPIPLKLAFDENGVLVISGVVKVENNGSYRDGAKITLSLNFGSGGPFELLEIINQEIERQNSHKNERILVLKQQREAAEKELSDLKASIQELTGLASS